MKKSISILIGITVFLSILFTACHTESELPDITDKNTASPYQKIANTQGEITFLIPAAIGTEQNKITAFNESLTRQDVFNRLETYRVFRFLDAHRKLDALLNDQPDFDLLSVEDVKQYAPREASQFKSFDTESGTRGCSTVHSECIDGDLHEVQICYISWLDITYIKNKVTANHSSCPQTTGCQSNSQCPSWKTCTNGSCVFYPPGPCNNCPPGKECNEITGECEHIPF